jgi:hypothetical protein
MTLCIAAIARAEKKIVTVCDTMLSHESTSVETDMMKVTFVGRSVRWKRFFRSTPGRGRHDRP